MPALCTSLPALIARIEKGSAGPIYLDIAYLHLRKEISENDTTNKLGSDNLLAICLIYSWANISYPISARQNSKKSDVQKWEYCAIYGKIGLGNGTGGIVWYFHESGTQFPNPSNDGDAAKDGDSYFRTVAKLGAEGWEMVGPNTDGYLLFKRPIQ